MTLAIPVSSKQYVKTPVSATQNGVAYDPTADVVEMAFLPVGVEPVSPSSAIGSTATYDDFQRVDGFIGGNGKWAAYPDLFDPGVQIINHFAVPLVTAEYGSPGFAITLPSFDADMEAWIDVGAMANGGDISFGIRDSGNNVDTYYAAIASDGSITTNIPTGLSAPVGSIVVGDRVGLSAVGTAISLWRKRGGNLTILDDATYAAVNAGGHAWVGFDGDDVGQKVSAFGVGNLGAWHTAEWETAGASTSSPTYFARCLVGPGAVELETGQYIVWVRITSSPEVPVIQAGTLAIVSA